MKKEIAEKWVEALRSGKYKQGIGYLCNVINDQEHYCCLGVLCDILKTPSRLLFNPQIKLYDKESFTKLPKAVREISGIKSVYGRLEGTDSNYTSLSGMNDCDRSFEEIADIIEKNWEKL